MIDGRAAPGLSTPADSVEVGFIEYVNLVSPGTAAASRTITEGMVP